MPLSHIDLTDPDHFLEGNPHHWLTEIRNEDSVHWHEGSSGAAFWCVTKWDDLRYVSRNPKLFSSQRKGTNMPNPRMEEMMRERLAAGEMDEQTAAMVKQAEEGGGVFPIMLMMDPPRHGE
jgi:cytochrome P450